MIININDDMFAVDTEQFTNMERSAYYTDPDNGTTIKDFIKISEWVEQHGVLIDLDFVMSKLECQALITHLEHDFISYDNPLASQVLTRMMNFVRACEKT